MVRLTIALPILLVVNASVSTHAFGQEAPERIIAVRVKAVAGKDREASKSKLSPELQAVVISGGVLVGNAPDGTIVISGVQEGGVDELLDQRIASSVAKEAPKNTSDIKNLRLSYIAGAKPSEEDLKKLDLELVEDYAKGSFMIVKPTKKSAAISAKLLTNIQKAPNVTYIAPIMKVRAIDPRKGRSLKAAGGAVSTPNDPRLAELWGMTNCLAADAWDCVTEGSTIVAVIDTGVDYGHQDLAKNMWTNPSDAPDGIDNDGNGLVDDVYGADFVNGDADPMDDHSHGTHCAGTVAGCGNNSVGVVGVNWKTPVMALKWLDAGGSGTSVDAIKCIDYAVEHGAKVLSNSWWHPDDPELREAIIRARDAGVLFVAAAGNFDLDNDDSSNYYRYPSSYDPDNIISVVAIDSDENKAGFSSYGATTTDLAAAGVDVLSSVPGDNYEYFNGTSMATPHVAGAAALIWNTPSHASKSWQEVKESILSNARSVPSLAGKCHTGGTLDVSFLKSNCSAGPSPSGCCLSVAEASFGWDEGKAVSSNSNIAEATIRLDHDSDVLIHCSTSARSDAGVTFSTGVLNDPDENVMWTYSLRSITAEGASQSVPILSDMTIRLPKGEHTIYWKIWVWGGELTFDSGTLQIVAVPVAGTSSIQSTDKPAVTRFGEMKKRAVSHKE